MELVSRPTTLLQFYLIAQAAMAVYAQSSIYPSREFQLVRGPFLLSTNRSVEVITVTNSRSEIDCVTRCQSGGCSVAVVVLSRGTCQHVFVSDALQSLDSSANQLNQIQLGSEPGARVWKAVAYPLLNSTSGLNMTSLEFRNSSTGCNGSIQYALINVTGCYRIEAAGARGGNSGGFWGGAGAYMAGNFSLVAGMELEIVVGQQGGCTVDQFDAPGGGGGSFVYWTASRGLQLLLAAGGGGGASHSKNGSSATGDTSGSNSTGDTDAYSGLGGVDGQPGFNNPNATPIGINHGGCGAGWLGKAVNPRKDSFHGDSGYGRVDEWVGGSAGDSGVGYGGFGGGGGGGSSGGSSSIYEKPATGVPGAGGGYSGGGAAVGNDQGGGSGGSYCSGVGCTVVNSAAAGGDGFVSMRLLMPFATCV